MTTSLFADRLDFLMRLTNTQNSALARALNFDASYISRIRSGRRGMPRHQPFVEPAAAYFAVRLREPYQRKAVADAICRGREWPDNEQDAAALIVAWLGGDDLDTNPIDQLLEDIVSLSKLREEGQEAKRELAASRPTVSESVDCYYGDEGKREAVEAFLTTLASDEESVDLLLFSDECMSWLYDDAEFESRWAALLSRIASQGGHIRIVHNISRDLDEMLGAIRGWLPLYMTGAIEPWWCPRVRDGIYRRTLFIARGHSAIMSNSIGDDTEGMLNLVVRDAGAVAALEREYANYISLCRPLMKFEAHQDVASCTRWLHDLAAELRASEDDVMLSEVGDGEFYLLVREGASATLFHKSVPVTVATVTEWTLAASFCEYLRRLDNVWHGGDEVASVLEATRLL